MKKELVKFRFGFLLLLIIFSVGRLFAQPGNMKTGTMPVEKLHLISDRDVYCVDEVIHLKLINRANDQGSNIDWSNVAYCEIITPDGRSVCKEKLMFVAHGASGDLIIPHDILSGNYYLCGYTRWMRNQSPYSYAYKPVKIINPFTTGLNPNVAGSEKSVRFSSFRNEINKCISIDKPDSVFSRNSDIQIRLRTTCDVGLQDQLSVSVVRKGTHHSLTFHADDDAQPIKAICYIPETRGVSLSGKVINRADSLPVPYARVWMTLFTTNPLTRQTYTDSIGNFYFDLGVECGQYDLYIQATSNKEGVVPIVLVDNDFSGQKITLPYIPFEINDEDRKLYEDVIINSQLQNIFHQYSSTPDSLKISFDHLFYGKPDFVLKFDQFIELPSVKDYVSELMPNIRLKKIDSKNYLKIYSTNPDMAYYEPLVMVDLVKFDDAESILKLSPKQIDRVEVVKVPYLKGDNIYGGIIHFITKTFDFSTISFPEGGIMLDYDLIGKSVGFPEYCKSAPIVGNCLYWEPSFRVDAEGSVIHFNTGSECGEYDIVIEGLDKDNTPFEVIDSFVVR